jgi:hypothetical protein
MSKSRSTKGTLRKQVVITNTAGEIIASANVVEQARPDSQSPKKLETGVTALPSQSIHIIEMPEDFFRCKSAIEKHRWLSDYRIVHDPEPRLMEAYRIRPKLS